MTALDAASLGRDPRGGRRVARGAVVEGDNLDAAARPAGRRRRPRLRGPAVRDRLDAAPGDRSAPAPASASGAGSGGREYRYEVVRDLAWDDDCRSTAHLEALRARLVEIHRVLASDGSLYLHVDWRTATTSRLLLDEVFGPSGSSTRSCGPTTTAAARATAGRASTTRSCGTRRATRGPSSATRSTGSRTSRRGWSVPRRRPAASCPPTCGG